MSRRTYVGNAGATTLSADITAASTSITVADATNWPSPSSTTSVAVIARGTASEEKITFSGRTGNTLTGCVRGFDSTTAAAHVSGDTIEHGLSATDMDETNDHTFTTTRDDHTQYLNTTRHDVTARHTFGAALGTPAAGGDVTVTAGTAGSGTVPARSDHTHKGTGTLGYAQVTTNQGSITTLVDLTGLSVTVTVAAGRRIRISAQANFSSTVADDTAEMSIREGGTQFAVSDVIQRPANIGATAVASAILSPSAGTHTYKLTAARAAGSGTVTMGASATAVAYILVEDIGV